MPASFFLAREGRSKNAIEKTEGLNKGNTTFRKNKQPRVKGVARYMDRKRIVVLSFLLLAFLAVWNGLAGMVDATNSPILSRFSTISSIALTIPATGDVNPYGVARVKHSVGNLKEGHLLISNFNKSAAFADEHPVVLDVAPDGSTTVFSRLEPESLPGSCLEHGGYTSGIAVLRDGWVIVGIMPAVTELTRSSGCLVVLDNQGVPVETFSGSLINGPRDLAVFETDHEAKLFVSNVLNGKVTTDGEVVNEGTVVRINLSATRESAPRIDSMTVVGSGFPERSDPDALIIGPTGLGLSPHCGNGDEENCPDYGAHQDPVLYLVDGLNDRIALIRNAARRTTSAGLGETLSSGGSLNDPLGLIVAPNGHLLIVNREDRLITEITPGGQQVAHAPAGQYRQTAWNRRSNVEREPQIASWQQKD